jgi:xanthine dehydrogenase accessory factor
MGITADMRITGSVSGGCVETAVVQAALAALADGQPRLLDFGVADETAWDVGLACGGQISVYIEPLDAAWWQLAAEHAQHERALCTATVLTGPQAGCKLALAGDQTSALASNGEVFASPGMSAAQRADLAAAARAALEDGKTQRASVGELDVFLEVYQPRPRLIIVGGAHVAVVLTDMAQLLGFRVVLVDPRQAFATRERFPQVEQIIHEYPDAAFAELGLSSDSYVAILTHDPKIDDRALQIALPSPVPYVGVLSSRRTHQKRIERLTQAGMAPALLERIHTPIGLAIGAQTPAEIALAILAEIVALRRAA